MKLSSGEKLLSSNSGKKAYRIHLAMLSISIKKKERPHNTCFEKILHFLQGRNTSSFVLEVKASLQIILPKVIKTHKNLPYNNKVETVSTPSKQI